MQAALRLRTRVLSGSRIEVTAPELAENDEVELIVLKTGGQVQNGHFASAWDYIQSLEPVKRSPQEWEAVERELCEEKDAWER